MPAKRTYKVRVAKDFIVLAGIFFFLCLWAVRDAWYPSDKVLKKHPHTVEASFPIDGTLKKFEVKVGDSVTPPNEKGTPTLLASLDDMKLQIELEAKTKAYVELQVGVPEKKALEKEIKKLRVRRDQYQMSCPKLGNEKSGKVSKLLVNRLDMVKAGQPVMEIEPNKHFYLFNKSLAIFSFFAFWTFLGLHFLAQ